MFLIQVRFLIQTICLSTPFDILTKKICLGQKVFFLINVKLPENLIFDTQLVEKCTISGVLANFRKRVSFWGPYLSSKHFSYRSLNFSRQGASFKYPYDYFLSGDFFNQKRGKIGQNSNILL